MNTDRLFKFCFLEYQRAWLRDASRFKIGLWARQTGKDYTASAEAVRSAVGTPGTHWLILAAGERQALETLRKAKEWVQAFQMGIARIEERRSHPQARLKACEITLANRSRITAVPARPETIRGFTANLLLTEFAFHEQPEEIWKAIFPAISNPVKGGKKMVRIISTPNGRGSLFQRLWEDPAYARHKITIYDAVRAGMPLEIAELKAGLNDPEAWAQEYECEFMDTSSVLLPYDLIESCESEEASDASTPENLARLNGPLFAGIDFGRKKDLTVCWILEKAGETLWTREVLVLDRMSTPEQAEVLRSRLVRARRVCLDYTGSGIGLGDLLAREFGEWKPGGHLAGKLELCPFTPALKLEMFPKLRAAFESGTIRIPINRQIREDLHGLHRVISRHGTIHYRAAHTEDGHSDRSTALALALRAAQSPALSTGLTVLEGFDRRRFRG